MTPLNNYHCWPKVKNGTIQTRSETTGLIQHETLMDALEAARKDPTIWKISYNSELGYRRYVKEDEQYYDF